MIPAANLKELARARLRDAAVLFRAGRFDAAEYILGYAIELALKARICRTLRRDGYPETSSEFRDLAGFKTHALEPLLHISGIERRIRTRYGWAWMEILEWDPRMRYRSIGTARPDRVKTKLTVTRHLLKVL
jgi:HEPN domain-containing protein